MQFTRKQKENLTRNWKQTRPTADKHKAMSNGLWSLVKGREKRVRKTEESVWLDWLK